MAAPFLCRRRSMIKIRFGTDFSRGIGSLFYRMFTTKFSNMQPCVMIPFCCHAVSKIPLFGIALLLISCSPKIVTQTDYDRSTDIRQFRTYNWMQDWKKGLEKEPVFIDTVNDKAVRSAVNEQMQAAGYVVSRQPGLLLHYHIIIEDKTQVNPALYGYEYGAYWIGKGADVYHYKEGTFILDIMDTQNRVLLWRGWAFSDLDDKKLSREQLIRMSVAKMFKKFPELTSDSF
jgi:hypothetical protein